MSTQIAQRQIADGAINDSKIQAGAAIATSKLAGGADFVTKDGLVAMTGNLPMGNQKITGLQTATNNDEAVNLGQLNTAIQALNSLFDAKGSVRIATTVAGTLASDFENGDTIDGIVLATGDRILIKNQAAPSENGIYVVAASGAPARADDMNLWAEIPGAFVAVEQGTANADTIWLCTANGGGTLNTTAITWQQIPTTAGLTNSNFVDKETPSGAVNGVNVTFVLANTPVAGSDHVYLNGLFQDVGAGNDYTISGATITYLTAPLTNDKLRVSYRKA